MSVSPLKIDLATIAAMCRGNPKLLPPIWVHDDDVWTTDRVVADSQGRIHVARRNLRLAVGDLPIVEGPWVRHDVQAFRIDLSSMTMGGGDHRTDGSARRASRTMVTRPTR